MSWVLAVRRHMLFLIAGLVLTGCWPGTDTALDEQKDPYYITGKNRANSYDYNGAIQSFEKALEVNPRSGSAHFELGLLFEQQINDYAAAVYHYGKFLQLRPKTPYTNIIAQRIMACKQGLARSVLVGPVSPALQRELEKLTMENWRLRQQVEILCQRLLIATNTPTVTAPAPVPSVAFPPPAGVLAPNLLPPLTNRFATALPSFSTSSPPAAFSPSPAKTTKTHTIKSGETYAIIARKYRISVAALERSNPSIDPRRLRPGQTLNLPPP